MHHNQAKFRIDVTVASEVVHVVKSEYSGVSFAFPVMCCCLVVFWVSHPEAATTNADR